MTLWNSKSEVIACLHEPDGQKQKTLNQMISKSGLMTKRRRSLMNIVKLTKSHELKQYAEEYTCFWYRNKNIGSLLYLAGRTVNRYRPDPCGSGVNILLHLPQKVNYDFLRGCLFIRMEQEKQYEAPGYMTYREAALMFSLMPESDAAKAIKATVNYYLYGQMSSGLDGVAEKVFQIMRADIDRNNAKYQEICKRNVANGKLGGRPRKR